MIHTHNKKVSSFPTIWLLDAWRLIRILQSLLPVCMAFTTRVSLSLGIVEGFQMDPKAKRGDTQWDKKKKKI